MADLTPMQSVVTPTLGVGPRSALATSMHAAPGVYAVLVGSGMSRAAGVPTGWQVVQDLIRRVAVAEGATADEIGDRPEDWWERQSRGEPRYERLLDDLASTDAARQGLLRAFFDPDPGAPGRRTPTAAHNALASLCATGRVRVVLTTNFDRLIERALDNAGVAPQVVSSADAVRGMIPLAHAPTTVIKLHGDYLSSGLRNTLQELSRYHPAMTKLLKRVLDEYGLVVAGWSGEYDVALREAIERCPTRRYPTYWATFGDDITEHAQRLVAARGAARIETRGADELFTDLVRRVERLDQIAARRGKPKIMRSCAWPLSEIVPPGWGTLPRLHVRVVSLIGHVLVDDCGLIGPEQRSDLLDALRRSELTSSMLSLMSRPRESAIGGPSLEAMVDVNESLLRSHLAREWAPAPGVHQSTDQAVYRLGGDASSGASALVTVRLPSTGHTDTVLFMLDVGLSLKWAIGLGEIAALLRDGLVATSAALPTTIEDILPVADVVGAELHLGTHVNDGWDTPPLAPRRTNMLAEVVELSSFGERSRNLPESTGCGVRVPGELSDEECATLAVDALDYLALASGYLDPRPGVAAIRTQLGVALR